MPDTASGLVYEREGSWYIRGSKAKELYGTDIPYETVMDNGGYNPTWHDRKISNTAAENMTTALDELVISLLPLFVACVGKVQPLECEACKDPNVKKWLDECIILDKGIHGCANCLINDSNTGIISCCLEECPDNCGGEEEDEGTEGAAGEGA